MDRIREWSFPVALLTAWIAVAGYTLSSLGHAQAVVAAAQKPAVVAPPIENATPVIAKQVSMVRKSHKPVAHREPRS